MLYQIGWQFVSERHCCSSLFSQWWYDRCRYYVMTYRPCKPKWNSDTVVGRADLSSFAHRVAASRMTRKRFVSEDVMPLIGLTDRVSKIITVRVWEWKMFPIDSAHRQYLDEIVFTCRHEGHEAPVWRLVRERCQHAEFLSPITSVQCSELVEWSQT